MGNIEKMTIEQWESKYKPIVNPNAEDEYSADRFETYGEDLDYVLNIANTTPKKVWTLEDIDGQLIICAGYHLVNRINYFVTEIEWEDENIEVQYCDEDKLCFSTIEDGLVKIKEAYRNREVVEGEFADYLVNNYNECFDSTVDPLIAIQAIQKFRQWDYETEGEDAIETFGGVEALSDNGYYGFIFMRNGQSMQLPDGVRIGIQTEDGGIALDEGIEACFKETKCFNANDYTARQLIEMEFENLLSLIAGMSVNGVNIIDIPREKNFEEIVDSDDATFQIFTQNGTITVDWGEGENAIDVYADSSVNEELVKAFRYQEFPHLTIEEVFDYFQSKK